MVALTGFLISIPWVIFWSIVELIFPLATKRACPTCHGNGYVPIKQDDLYKPCEHCDEFGYSRKCPECHGTQFTALEVGDLYEPCPDCKNGSWPRAWAWKLNTTQGPDGLYCSDLFNRIYSYSIEEKK